jgi:hypothetical protein
MIGCHAWLSMAMRGSDNPRIILPKNKTSKKLKTFKQREREIQRRTDRQRGGERG